MFGLKLWILSLGLGAGFVALNLPGVLNPAQFAERARRFPRNTPVGYPLMLLATVWFLYYVKQENVADFANLKNALYAAFTVVGVGACLYLKDFLPVRGLAVLLLLGAKLVVDTARPVDSDWRLLLVSWAYVWVVMGMWLTVSPWRLRDMIQWATADLGRLRLLSTVHVAFGFLVIIIAVTALRVAEQKPLSSLQTTPQGIAMIG